MIRAYDQRSSASKCPKAIATHALTRTSKPCPRGSKRSAVRSARWLTPRIPRWWRPSSARAQPYFTLDGNICALLAAKAWVNVFLYDGALVPDPHGIITSGHANKTARTVAIRQGEKVNAPALKAMFKQIIANNRAGGWRKLKSA